MTSDAPEGRPTPALSHPIALPEPLTVPNALCAPETSRSRRASNPAALEVPAPLGQNADLGVPEPLQPSGTLILPGVLPTPSMVVGGDSYHRPVGAGNTAAVGPASRGTTRADDHRRRTSERAGVVSSSPSTADPARRPSRVASGRSAPGGSGDKDETAPRRRLSKRCVILPSLAVAAIALLDSEDRDRRREPTPTAATAGADPGAPAPVRTAVGMPIPGGNVPVEPVRVVLNVTSDALPAREQRELAQWIEHTQHPMTRIRLRRNGRLSTALTARALETATPARAGGTGQAWLRNAQAKGIAAAQINVGEGTSGTFLGSGVRTLSVSITESDRRTTRAPAAKVAREIMDVSRQRDVGTTTP